MILGAGGLAFAGSFKESSGFPPNGYAIIAGTVVLTFLASFTSDGALDRPVKALAGLMLLVSAIKYVPGLSTGYAKKG